MLRRQFVTALAAAPFALAKQRIDLSSIAVLTDEVGKTPGEAIDFAKQYGVRWVELRAVPGGKGHYIRQSEADLKQAAKEFADNGLKVSFLNTGFFKITLPGSEAVLRNPETPEAKEKRIAKHKVEFDRWKEDLQKAIVASHIFNVDKIRVFTFLRVAEPTTVYPQIADVLGEMSQIAAKENIKILIENEVPCNVVTCAEMAAFVKLLPAKWVGLNWDPMNGTSRNENPFPDGYKLLPIKRLWNVQMKGHTLLDPAKKLDWAAIYHALAKDGYKGKVGLETHYFDGTLIEKSHLSMKEIVRIVES